MSGVVKFRDLADQALFWRDGDLYRKIGDGLALRYDTGQRYRFFAVESVRLLTAADLSRPALGRG